MHIRFATPKDAPAIANIYNYYILETTATFEETIISADEMASRIKATIALDLPWLVAENEDETVIGYAYASKWKGRCAYRFSVETTVYLAPDQSGKGLGRQLYERLFAELKSRDYHVVIGGITLPNPASVALHEKMGLTHMGTFKEVGYKFGRWIDVGYWQKIL